MISRQLEGALVSARSSLKEVREWSMMNSIPGGTQQPRGAEYPREYVDLMQLADGGIFGRVLVFDLDTVGRAQFYADRLDGAPVQLGGDTWFCFGKVNEDPLFLDRRDGTVWGFADTGVIWWQSLRYEKFADSLGEFLETQVFGPGYAALTGAPDDEQWLGLLSRIGCT